MADRLLLVEQETAIVFNRSDALATIFTHDSVWIRHMDALGVKGLRQGQAVRYEVPKGWIPKPRKTRRLSPEQREAAGDRLREHRQRAGA